MDFDFSTETITPDNTALLTIGGTGAIEVPIGTTANRPVTGLANGALRYNTDINNLEGYINSGWNTISTGSPSVTLTGDVTGTGTSSIATTLATVNSNVGTFASVTVNGKGLVTAATALSGDITSSGAVTTLATVNGNVGTFTSFTVNAKGLITAATNMTASGDATGTSSSANLPLTLATVNSNVGTFASVTVNGKGLATAAANLSGDITSSGAVTTLATVNSNVGTFASATFNGKGLATAAANLSGDITSSGAVTTLATVNAGPVTASFQRVTTNAKGLVTATSSVTSTDITTALGYTPLNLTGGSMTGTITMDGTHTVTGLPTPSAASDAAPKSYVDSLASGLEWKNEVMAASTVSLTVTYSNGTSGVGATLTNAGTQAAFAIDGYTASLNDRILIKNQTAQLQNGIYTVTTVGTGATNWVLTRATDANTPSSLNNATMFVTNGTVGANTGWTQTTANPTIGTNNIVFVQFSGTGTYTNGTGISLTGNVFANTGVLSVTSNTGLSTNTAATGAVTITNTGVTSNVAGTGIGVSGATGAVTITNNGVTSAVAGTGIGVSGATGAVTFTNSGVTSNVAGTNITVSGATGAVTINTSLTPSFTTITSTQATGTAPFTVASTTNVANLNASLLNGATFAAPGTIGGTTPGAITGTTITANTSFAGALNGTVGATTPNTGSFTALTATGIISHSTGTNSQTYATTGAGVISISSGTTGSIDNMAIGATTASTGKFTTLTATGLTANSFLYSGTGGLLSTTTAPANGQILIGSTGAAPVIGSIAAGTGISVTPGAGTISIANTGVTSVALSLPSFITVSGSPVTTTGTLTGTLATQTTNTVFIAPNGSTGAPTFRTLAYADLPLKLYVENPSTPTTPLAAGANAIGFGSGTSASATSSEAHGLQSLARVYGQVATSSGQFATLGDAQHGEYNLRAITSNNTLTEVFLDGSSARLVLPNNSAFMFVADVVCRRTDSTGTVGAWTISGLIFRDATASTTAISGSVSKTTIAKAPSTMDVTTTADTTNGSLKIAVTGVTSQTIRWSVYIRTQEVTN